MRIKPQLCDSLINSIPCQDVILNIFKKAFFKPETTDELKDAVKLWINDEEKALNKYGHISFWNTILITDMNYLFKNAKNFNQPIGNWNVSNVTNMSDMFFNAKKFDEKSYSPFR